MDLKHLLGTLKNQLEGQSIDFALIGGLAVGGLGYQRFTNDIDILVHEDDRARLRGFLVGLGYTIFAESTEFLQLQGPCPVYVQFARRPLSQRMLKEAVLLPALNVRCLKAEDIIGLKIQAYVTNAKREHKEKADIQALIEVRGGQLDWQKIQEYADLFSQWPAIQELKAKVGI